VTGLLVETLVALERPRRRSPAKIDGERLCR